MFNIEQNNKSDIFFIGDIHGEFKSIANWIKTNSLHDCILIFCGDFGVGFDGLQKEHQDLLRADRVCEEKNVDCYVIRGNHDDPSYFDNSNKLDLSRFKLVSDYTVIKTPEHNILCLGGAVSTDRQHRQQSYETEVTELMHRRHLIYEHAKRKVKRYWWPNEAFNYDESILEEIIESDLKIDTICSHSAPINCPPLTSSRVIFWSNQDDTLSNDIREERENLDKVLHYLKDNNQPITNWYHGHYHEHHLTEIDNVTFHALDMGRNGRMSGGPGGNFDMAQLH